MKSASLNKLAWTKLKKDTVSFFSLLFIVFLFFLATFSVLISPDNSRNANEMHLELKTMDPFSKVLFLKTPKKVIAKNNFLSSIFVGFNHNFERLPITSFIKINGGIEYLQYNQEIYKKYIGEYKIEEQVFWLGTDKYGRDFLSRILYGLRISLSVGLIAVIISLVIGISLGLLAGYFRGRVDNIIMWFVNVIWSIPTLLMVIAITLALGKGFWQVFIAVGLTMWVEVARIVRGQVFIIRELEFVEAGKALAYKPFRIIFKHILPNVVGPLIVISAANFSSAILIEAGLSFLGIGAQPPIPSWGNIIKENYNYIIMGKPFLAVVPGLAIMCLVLAFMILGNGLRDAFDVKN